MKRCLLILLITVFFMLMEMTMGCSGQRYHHRSMNNSSENIQVSSTDSLCLSWRAEYASLRFSQANQQVWIWPIGEFRYLTDSGFSGQAQYILIERQEASTQYRTDSASGSVILVHSRDSLHSDLQHSDQRLLEVKREVSVGAGIKGWWWLVVFLILIFIGCRWWVKKRGVWIN